MFVLTSWGLNLKLIFVWPNLAMQLKEYCVWARRRNKVIAFPQWKHIFPCLKSLATLFWSVWGAHSLSTAFPQRDSKRIWYLVLCVCFCVYLCRFETTVVSGCAYWHTHSTSLCTCVRVSEHECVSVGEGIDECVHTCICLLLFIACSIFCIT